MLSVVSLIGIVIALILFLICVYKGLSPLWTAIICSIVVAACSLMSVTDLVDAYVGGLVSIIESLFSIVFFGAILGHLYSKSGAASSIATTLTKKLVLKAEGDKQIRLGLLVILIVAALCTMGGIDGYVLTFTMVPVCLVMCEMLDIPRRFVGGMMVLNCAFMACPGAPQIDNIMARAAVLSEAYSEDGAFLEAAASTGFSVTSYSAAIPGLVAVAFIAISGYLVLSHYVLKAKHAGEHFEWGSVRKFNQENKELPNFVASILPLIVVFVLYTLVPILTGVEVDISIALVAGIIVGLLLFAKYLPKKEQLRDGSEKNVTMAGRIAKILNDGSHGFPNALVTLAVPSALAGVVTASAGFGLVVGVLSGIQVHYIVLTLIVVCILEAITSSPPAALMIAIPLTMNIMLGQGLAPAEVLNNAGAVMRIGALAATTFETLPFNGLIILTLSMIGCDHKEAYKPMFMQSCIFTLIGTIICAVLIIAFPGLA